jgi:alkanesulfonate monooxygenase SsuD/methylene tetrahydromethanopterin reductase-like flavin-dependent oxidoreductase (luciferase family)
LGYDTVWVADRLLYPVNPRNPYPATPDGSLPEYCKNVLAPLESMAFAAAVTSRISLGSSIIDLPFYNPVVLARALTTSDVLSGGRLRVGFGLGWSEDEFEAVGVAAKGRGVRATEFLQVLNAVWTTSFTARSSTCRVRSSAPIRCRNPIHRFSWRHIPRPRSGA